MATHKTTTETAHGIEVTVRDYGDEIHLSVDRGMRDRATIRRLSAREWVTGFGPSRDEIDWSATGKDTSRRAALTSAIDAVAATRAREVR